VKGIELPDAPVEASLGAQVRALGPGTLCLLRRPRGAADVARQLEDATVLDETTREADWALAVTREGGAYWVRLEDPSVRLGWMLRRLEEGARVIVETGAHTFDGARRVLLGVQATPRAEAWLSVHRVCWLVPRDDGWTLEG
jgi:hypothetical protein